MYNIVLQVRSHGKDKIIMLTAHTTHSCSDKHHRLRQNSRILSSGGKKYFDLWYLLSSSNCEICVHTRMYICRELKREHNRDFKLVDEDALDTSHACFVIIIHGILYFTVMSLCR